jgi:hypothetical protein
MIEFLFESNFRLRINAGSPSSLVVIRSVVMSGSTSIVTVTCEKFSFSKKLAYLRNISIKLRLGTSVWMVIAAIGAVSATYYYRYIINQVVSADPVSTDNRSITTITVVNSNSMPVPVVAVPALSGTPVTAPATFTTASEVAVTASVTPVDADNTPVTNPHYA